MHGLTGDRVTGEGRRMSEEKAHNAASEFARAVRASSLREHIKKLAGSYDTSVARALAALRIRSFNKVEPIKAWRRGRYKAPGWAIQALRDQLEQDAELLYEIAEQLRHDVGPRQGKHGAAHWRRYHAQKAAEKEKGPEGPDSLRE
jgi:hypothetical protein